MGSTSAQVKLVPLKNCFANLPRPLVNVLGSSNAVVQDVIVELRFNNPTRQSQPMRDGLPQTIYLGWTGMASAEQGSSGGSTKRPVERDESSTIEIDATLGRTLSLSNGLKVNILLHLEAPLAHTVHIEPLTSADWEIIELHASFLESNLLFQVRALPNPSYSPKPTAKVQVRYPLTIHLSPTSTANIIVTSLTPPLPAESPFARIAPDGEVIVAPKTRSQRPDYERKSSRSITSRRSEARRNGQGKQSRSEENDDTATAVLLRPVDKRVLDLTFEDEDFDPCPRRGLAVWVDQDLLRHQSLKRTKYVCISLPRPAGIQPPLDHAQQERLKEEQTSDAGSSTSTVVARLLKWKNTPDLQHAALSPLLCSTLGIDGIVGGVVRISRASPPMSAGVAEGILVYPFTQVQTGPESIRVTSQVDKERQAIVNRMRRMMKDESNLSQADIPLTDGQLIPQHDGFDWNGALIRIKGHPQELVEDDQDPPWCFWNELQGKISVKQSIAPPLMHNQIESVEHALPDPPARVIGVDDLCNQLRLQLLYGSPSLVTGSLGSGKTSFVQCVASCLRAEELYHVTYVPLRDLASNESQATTVKETLTRLLMTAAWGAKLGSRALIILDDLDRLYPAETELQTTDNTRSRQLSENLVSLFRQHCQHDSKVSILGTSQSADSLHGLIAASNVFKETIALKAPDKDQRRDILQNLLGGESGINVDPGDKGWEAESSPDDSDGESAAWMNGAHANDAPSQDHKFQIGQRVELLDVAGQTDGFMPGDLMSLMSRAKNEAIIRTIEVDDDRPVKLTKEDFDRALKDFTPATLRNVTLQSSQTKFDSVGGLRQTRRILLETLMYPTKYAPIFSQCPLRLRSGLLLYGYPGCGKTLLASAVAGECGLNFISVKGPEILNKYIGASEKSVRDLFERAESAKPCVLFFDEFDSIAPKRGHDSTGVTDRVVNQMLTQMDGAEGLSGVYVLAATSRPDLIDPALLRPGRLDKSLLCDMPGYDDRLDILKSLAKKLTIAASVLSEKSSSRNLAEIARRTEGYSGADLQAVIYNAHLEAIHHVLGGKNHGVNGSTKPSRKDVSRIASSKHDILQFPFHHEEDDSEPTTKSRAQGTADYAAIVGKFEALMSNKKKEKVSRKGVNGDGMMSNGMMNNDSANTVIIEWSHIEASLASTRSSIGTQERRRLGMIYREFIVGRNGEMPDGQAVNEIGGRTSLM